MVGSQIDRVDLWDLARRSLHSCPPLTRDEQRLVRAGQDAIVRGESPSLTRLSELAGVPLDRVTHALDRLSGLARYDVDGRIVGMLGASARPTPHRFEAGGGPIVYTWCAWDALFIPRVIGRTARVASHCPVLSSLVRLTVGPDGVLDVSPSTTSVSFRIAGEPESGRGIVGACCPDIHFLSTPLAVERWQSEHTGGVVLSVEDAWQLGRMFVDDVLFAQSDAESR